MHSNIILHSNYIDELLTYFECRRSLRVQLEAKKDNKLTYQSVSIDEKEVNLRRKITLWFAIQHIYMPCVDTLRPAPTARDEAGVADDGEVTLPESISAADVSLNLPESLPAGLRSQLPSKLLAKHRRLRLAQAEDAMNSMKKHLRKGATLFKHKKDHIAGTGVAANTRMQSAIARQESKTQLQAERYRAARDALVILCPLGKWKKRLVLLLDTDVRPPAPEGNTGEGRRKLTWIWRMRPALVDELEPGDEDEDVESGDADGGHEDANMEKAEANEGKCTTHPMASDKLTHV